MNISTQFLMAASRAYTGQVQNAAGTPQQIGPAQSTNPGPGSLKSDAVQLSQGGRDVKRLRDQMQDLPAVREDRVAALKQSIANGTYQVDTTKLAQRLLGL